MNEPQEPQENTTTPRERIARARADLLAALRNTFDSPDGQRVLAWLHTTAGTRRPAFTPGKAGTLCPLAAASRDGRASLVWEIEANLATARSEHGAAPTAAKPKARSTSRPRL
jgi:hypothetical protein